MSDLDWPAGFERTPSAASATVTPWSGGGTIPTRSGSSRRTPMFEALRERYRQWRIARRRKKLLLAYAKVGRRRHGLGPGFSPLVFAYDRVSNEGLASITTDGDLIWHWPEDTTDSDGDH